jgi:predicted DNA-binding protein (MmcQ/YjbR family)
VKDKPVVKPGSKPKGHAGRLRDLALSYPDAHEDFPWGERVVKVKGKVFAFLGRDEDGLGLSVKLPRSRLMALDLPFATPTAYGLGKSGWITARFGPRDEPPMDVLMAWIDESYRAVAPKKLIAELDGAPAAKPPARASRRKRTQR